MLHQDYAQFIESAVYEVLFNHIDDFTSDTSCFLSEEALASMLKSVDAYCKDLVAIGLPLCPDHCAFTVSDGSYTFVILATEKGADEISLSYFSINPENDGVGRHSWYRRFDGCVLNWIDFCHPIDLTTRFFDSLRKGLVIVSEEQA